MSINSPKTIPRLSAGFSLIELTVALLIVVLLAGIALRSTNELSFQVRYEQTQERLNRIKEAIIGNPHRTVNGQPDISGFVKDVGRLPFALQELVAEGYCPNVQYFSKPDCETNVGPGSWRDNGYGWHGPYMSISSAASDPVALSDGWGNSGTGNYGWNIVYFSDSACNTTPTTAIAAAKCMAIQSFGKDQIPGSGTSEYDADYPAVLIPTINPDDWTVDVNGITLTVIGHGVCSDPTKKTEATCQSGWTPDSPNLCLRVIRNGSQFNSSASIITQDGLPHDVAFSFANATLPEGKAIGIVYNDTNCAATTSFYSANNNRVCVNTNDAANFTQSNCKANNGLWIDAGTEQYCDLVSGSNCTGSTAPQLHGAEFSRFQVLLIPHTVLPVIYW